MLRVRWNYGVIETGGHVYVYRWNRVSKSVELWSDITDSWLKTCYTVCGMTENGNVRRISKREADALRKANG